MHYLISGLAKSGTTRLFTQVQDAVRAERGEVRTFFEPWEDEALSEIVATEQDTLSKVLIGRVHADNAFLPRFDRHVMIYRDPRDQFLSTLLYLFYDFQIKGDREGYLSAREALVKKLEDPHQVSVLDLYDEIAELAGRPRRIVFSKLHAVQQEFTARLQPFELVYENLIDGVATEALGHYLDLEIRNEANVDADYSRVARSKKYGEWRSWFTLEDQAWAEEHWGAHLRSLGYSLDRVTDAPSISKASSVDYVAQFEPG